MKNIEIALGFIAALLIFLFYLGYDVLPFLFLGILCCILYFFLDKKGLIKIGERERYSFNNKIGFEDIGGLAIAKKELQEALEFMLRVDEVRRLGIRLLKGILLTGPPGTGKTLMAKAASTYTNSAFIATSGSEFIEMYAGVGAQRVRNLFKNARDKAIKEKKKSAIIFIDELEVLGGKRGKNSSHLEYDQTLNQLLVEMDGLRNDTDISILVIGATNRADLLDDALLRPGRFDRQVKVELPDKQGRQQILELHTRNKPLASDVDLEIIAQDTFGFSGAHLENVANEAAILAMREGKKYICEKHFREAIDKVMLGEKLDKKLTKKEKYRVAVHEAGHALMSEGVRPGSVSYLTVSSRGNALGYTRQIPEKDFYLYTRKYLENQISILLAGAIAEEIILGSRSTGAGNDFKEAVKISKHIIFSGLSDLGIVVEDNLPKNLLNETVNNIIQNQEKIVSKYLERNKEILYRVINKLVDKENIKGEELRLLFKTDMAQHLEEVR